MITKIITSENFRNKAKRLLKRYRSLKNELFELENELKKNPELGTYLGNNCFKIRISIKSKGKGKSGGARIITHVVTRIIQNSEQLKIVGIITIFDKSEYENIEEKELSDLIAQLASEINDSEL